MPQNKQQKQDKQAITSLQLAKRRAKFKKRKKLKADAEKITSLKTAGRDPEYGYLVPGKTTKTGKADPRFSRGRRTDEATKEAISMDKSSRGAMKIRRKVTRDMKASDKPYSTGGQRSKTFSGHVPSVKSSKKFRRPSAKKKD